MELIARREGVRPEDVTVEYIRLQRELRLYPTTRYNLSGTMGGYDPTGLLFLTRNEFDASERRVDAELAEF